ncbi:MAG: ATP/GTP-binding protein [Candidatus Hydrothermarchaeaceae archaeon]
MINLYFIGTAGSGKSTLTSAFQSWMSQHGYDAITVNLDPGAERLQYPADIDVRDWINLPEVMDTHGLGPNGAQIVCADMLSLKALELKEVLDEFDADYALIDTPGQMELFAYRDSSRAILDAFGKKDSLVTFLFDPFLSRSPSGFVSLAMLCASIQFRIELPFVNILSKADLIETEKVEDIVEWSRDPNNLHDALIGSSPSMQVQSSIEFFRALEVLDTYREVIPVSSEANAGMEDVYNAVQQMFFGGEDLSKD